MAVDLTARRWSLEQIKAAFWAEFHKSGELWFSYFDESKEMLGITRHGSEADCESCTNEYWGTFQDHLMKQVEGELNAR